MAVPPRLDRPMQVMDVRDLARLVVLLLEQDLLAPTAPVGLACGGAQRGSRPAELPRWCRCPGELTAADTLAWDRDRGEPPLTAGLSDEEEPCSDNGSPGPSHPRRRDQCEAVAVQLLIVSDTHVPSRAKTLPDEVWDAVDAADVVVHAGDWTSAELHRELADRASQLVGVYGNNDGPELRDVLPEVARVTLAGVRFAVVHETGGRAKREARMGALFDEVDVLVFGHSHIPWDTTASTGLRLLNPGSPTDRRRQPACTYLTATVAPGRRLDVVLHRLPLR